MKERSKYHVIKELLYLRLPIIKWLPQYSWIKFLQDALAGTTVGLTVVPQGIAYAVVAGLPPHYGLYSSFMGCFVYIIFGSTNYVTVGPTAIMGLLTRPFVLNYGDDFAIVLTFLTGCVITMMGVLYLGFLVDFISMPIICGFTNAAAVIIGSSQIGPILGLKGRSDSFIDSMTKLFKNFNKIQLFDTLLGFFSMIILIGLKNLPGNRSGSGFRRCMWLISLARNAIVVVAGMLLAYCFSLFDYHPFQIIGMINEGLPSFSLPPFSTTHNNQTYQFQDMVNIFGSSIASVPLIALLESIAIAKAFAKGKTLDANQEMIAVGLCNFFGSFVRSMPITGSFTRTAVNNVSGVQTPMGGLVTGCLVLIVCTFLTKAFKFIPKATLAAIIIVAMYNMLDIKTFQILWKTKKFDLLALTVTLISCLAFGLDIGMLIGISLSIMMLLYGNARPGFLIEERNVGDRSILFVSPQQSITFPSAEHLRHRIMSLIGSKNNINLIIIDGRNINSIDSTVAKNLSLLFSDLNLRNQKLIFWNWYENTHKTLVAFDVCLEGHFKTCSSISQLVNDEALSSEHTVRIEPQTQR